jgi:hypothetical protein
MSRLRLVKVITPSNAPTGDGELFFSDSLVPAAPAFIDESGNIVRIGGLTTKDYRLLSVQVITAASGTYTPTSGVTAIYVEAIGGGGQGGGGPAGTGSSCGGGGGGGAYAAVWKAGLAASYAYVNGAGGSTTVAGNSTGQDGADTTFGAILTAKAGKGGLGHAISTTILTGGLGGAGGLASACVGDFKIDGAPGSTGVILSTAAGAISGEGASGLFGGGGGIARIAQGDGANGVAYGSGGSGGCTFNSAGATKGGNGGSGALRILELA